MNKKGIIALSIGGAVVVLAIIVVAVIALSQKDNNKSTAQSSQSTQSKKVAAEPKNACELVSEKQVSSIMGVDMVVDSKYYDSNPKYLNGKPLENGYTTDSVCVFKAKNDVIPTVQVNIKALNSDAPEGYLKESYEPGKESYKSTPDFKEVTGYGNDAYFSGTLYVTSDKYNYSVLATGQEDRNRALPDEKAIADLFKDQLK